MTIRIQLARVEPTLGNQEATRDVHLADFAAGVGVHRKAHFIPTYGGGQFELGVDRRQAQQLAALFHPDGPNDLALLQCIAPDLPAELPPSPLPADADRAGL